MSQSTARKTPAPTNDRPEDRPHVLTLPLEEQQADREPHSYERWLIAADAHGRVTTATVPAVEQ